ncbi:MAG: type II toxin-antitoxin system HipA family toxin [Flavobacteriales bacterium]
MAKGRQRRNIYVYAAWQGLDGPILMGSLYAEPSRGNEIFSFEYDKAWIESGNAQLLDPDLQLYAGKQYIRGEKGNFGLFLDSSPDRWGRLLMRRREAALARQEEREQVNLFETDFLLGVYDAHRMGGLRFKLDSEGPFLNDNRALASPPWTSIPELEQISLKLEEDNVSEEPEYLKWLSMLIAPGSSLGGARPKASVTDKNGKLWIAKFPSRYDDSDIGGWEMVTHELAMAAGIVVPRAMAKKFSSDNHTFLTQRFDRTDNGERLHFASAMTMLGHTDGEHAAEGVSYLELVGFITQYGSKVNEDLEQLWRRIVFNICVSNTDDHLRNHGFLLEKDGWTLSPAYDMNPVETGTGLKLNINEYENDLDLNLAMEVHTYFRLDRERAAQIIEEVKTAVRNWRVVAAKYHISKKEQELKSGAFGHAGA